MEDPDSCQRGGGRENWWKEGEGMSQRTCMNDHEHEQWCGD